MTLAEMMLAYGTEHGVSRSGLEEKLAVRTTEEWGEELLPLLDLPVDDWTTVRPKYRRVQVGGKTVDLTIRQYTPPTKGATTTYSLGIAIPT